MKKEYFIYKHINKINHKVYIGMTNNPKRRWASNGKEYMPKNSGSSRFWGAIQKYGWENFEHQILISHLTQEEAQSAERAMIAKYNATDRDKGYNIAPGGNGGKIYRIHPRGMLGHHQTDYEKKVHSQMLSDHARNPMTNGTVIWGVTRKHPRGMKGHHQSKKHRMAMQKLADGKSPNHKSFSITKPDGTILHFGSIRGFIKKYKIWQIRNILNGPQSYKLPQANMPNRKNMSNLKIVFLNMMIDSENTEITL